MFDGIKEALHHQKKYGGRIYVMDDVEMEKYCDWYELGEDWTIESNDGSPYFQHKYGGIEYSDFDYKTDDGKTYWHYKGEMYEKHKKTNTNSKYYIVSTSGERKMMNGFRYIKELLLQNHNFDTAIELIRHYDDDTLGAICEGVDCEGLEWEIMNFEDKVKRENRRMKTLDVFFLLYDLPKVKDIEKKIGYNKNLSSFLHSQLQ